jgi:caa(3)-type oxidase subunit IV
MAQEKKGKGKAQKSAASEEAHKADKAEAHEEDHASAKAAHDEEEHGDHGHGKAAVAGHGDAHADHDHKPNRKEYWVIFVALFLLTILEVGVTKVPGISKTLMRLALVGMALTKAGLVGLFYMHLKHETRILRLTVAIPLATPALYAVVLISEAAWRLIR